MAGRIPDVLYCFMYQPYLHESRHLHAMRRARGCGGRFLNTKKLDDAGNPTSEKGMNMGSNSSMQPTSSSGCLPTNGHGLSPTYHSLFSDGKEGDYMGQQRESMQMNGVARGALPIK